MYDREAINSSGFTTVVSNWSIIRSSDVNTSTDLATLLPSGAVTAYENDRVDGIVVKWSYNSHKWPYKWVTVVIRGYKST